MLTMRGDGSGDDWKVDDDEAEFIDEIRCSFVRISLVTDWRICFHIFIRFAKLN